MNVIKNFDWHKNLLECLESTKYCSLATVDSKGVWSNSVYFAWDKEFNFYFISQMSSRHMQNINKNSRISLSIYSTEQNDSHIGIQLEGTATILTDQSSKEEVKHAYDTYFGRSGHAPDFENYYTSNPKWLYVKIVPENIYYFNDGVFDEERQLVPLKDLK